MKRCSRATQLRTSEDSGGDRAFAAERGAGDVRSFVGGQARRERRAFEIGVVLAELDDGSFDVERGDSAREQLEP
jgi:hypothetical protein